VTAIRKHLKDFLALILIFVIAIAVTSYIVANQEARPRIPFIEPKAFELKAEFSDAQAVIPGQGQSVRIAGVQVGKITKVGLSNGMALVTMQLDPEYPKKIPIYRDATALLRPRTGLKDMFVELDPGGSGAVLKSGAEIPIENTSPDVDPDEVLSALDTDTREYLQLLINGAGKGLKGRGHDLNLTFKALGPTNRDLKRVTGAIAERRVALKELIHNYGDLTNTLADTDKSIRRLINSSDAVFRAFASQNENLSLAVSKLPATLRQTEQTLAKANDYAQLLGPTLESLRAPFRQLDVANHAVRPFAREAFPIVRDEIRPFVQEARPTVNDLRPAAKGLARATPDLTASFYQLNRLFNMGAHNPKGAEPVYPTFAENRERDEGYLFWVAWAAQNGNSVFSTADAQGVLRRIFVFANCNTIRGEVAAQPALGPVLGLTNALNTPGLCPAPEGADGGAPSGPTLSTTPKRNEDPAAESAPKDGEG
jgi:phospholipid/cholesterol/gamma-HCH transport system substrate-binding protein